jgi:O-Antigen ligase
MPAHRRRLSWRPSRDIPFLVLCIAIVLGTRRAPAQASFTFSSLGTEISLTATDFAFLVLAAFIGARLLGKAKLPEPARALTVAAGAFAAWLLISSAMNGVEPLVGAVKLLEYAVVALGAVLFIQHRWQLWALVGLIVGITSFAVVQALYDSGFDLGYRLSSYMGAHELAAIGTLSLSYGVASLHSRRREVPWLPWIALAAGAAATVLGAALASLLGMYLAFAALTALAGVRRSIRWPAVAATVAIAAAVTAGALSMRGGDLGFVQGSDTALSAERAGSWSQRLIYAYIGGRVFLANPILGTGWYGELPPKEYARFVPDARRTFPDQPPTYFPRADQDFIPQQTYDQILFQLGLLGAVLFLVVAGLAVRTAVHVGVRWPRGGPSETAAYLPAAWLAAMAGALAGEALFGGIAIATYFWLVLGIVALMPSLMPPGAPSEHRAPDRELAAATR